jgi:hypothetical protein
MKLKSRIEFGKLVPSKEGIVNCFDEKINIGTPVNGASPFLWVWTWLGLFLVNCAVGRRNGVSP